MALGIGGIGTGGTGGSWSNLYPRRLVDKVPSYKKKKKIRVWGHQERIMDSFCVVRIP